MSAYQWTSWHQPGDDYRPLTFPPNADVLGWWCTGYGEQGATLCAMVKASTESDAREVIKRDWPEAWAWRFCDPQDSPSMQSERFPLSEWMRERIEEAKGNGNG